MLLPAATRYESPGGGTETSTERRIIFSPEIPGRRVGSARPEWQAIAEAVARAHPDRAGALRFAGAAAIRAEIARAVPLYRGIETLAKKGDQVQWGGRLLFADGRFATARTTGACGSRRSNRVTSTCTGLRGTRCCRRIGSTPRRTSRTTTRR